MAADQRAGTSWYKSFDVVQTIISSPYREHWDRNIEYLLSCIGYCIGFGNIWRFPYVAYANGGGAFFIPYLIVTILFSLPIFFIECILGQFSGCNAISCFNFAPAFKGIGIGMAMAIFYINIYYVMFLVYSSKYIFASLSRELPWARCNPGWGSDSRCYIRSDKDNSTMLPPCSKMNSSYVEGVNCHNRQTATEQYWNQAILHTGLDNEYSITNIGSVQWDLMLVLLITWMIQFIFIIRGIKSSGKVVYFTATFPIVVLIIMLVFALQLDGASEGLKYLFEPKWKALLKPEVWGAAITQSFFSTGIVMGCLTLYSSYNVFNYKLHRGILFVVFMDIFASVCSAMTIFSVLGFLAYTIKVEIEHVVDAGPGLVFIVMPEAITKMPIPQLWSVLYFFMLYAVGIDSQSCILDTLITNIYEEIPKLRKKQFYIRVVVILILFLLGITCVTNGGIYVIGFLDFFATDVTLLFLAMCEVVAVAYVYGVKRFCSDIKFMVDYNMGPFWKVVWYLLPIVLFCLFIIGLITSTSWKTYTSIEILVIGWLLALSCMLPVPLWAIYEFLKFSRTDAKWLGALKPNAQWGPREIINKIAYLDWLRKTGQPIGPRTTTTLAELDTQVTGELPDVRAVAQKRLADRKYSVIHRFSHVFQPEQLEELEHRANFGQ